MDLFQSFFDYARTHAAEFTWRLLAAIATILVAWLAARVARTTLRRLLSRRKTSRARTLQPLVQALVSVVVLGTGVVLSLEQLGFDLTAVIAGAGVLGLAVGFGAQTLVKDVITGIFILVEESISVGDVVDLGGHSGVVEGMTIRSVRVRDVSGSVHIIPFSSVTTVVNMTKEFAYAVFNLGIAYEEDVDRATAVMQEVGRSLQHDPAFKSAILSPIEVFGIDSFTDLSVKLQARMKTRPGRQWTVSREFNRRVKLAFAQVGIEMPHHPLLPRPVLAAGAPVPEAVV
jgi:small-conductance mechanosensitive channel